MQFILILLSREWCVLVGTRCNLTWLSNELILAVSGVTAATARLPSLPVLTSSSPPFPFPAIDISSFSPFPVRATWTSFSSFSDSRAGLKWIWPWNCSWYRSCFVLFSSCCYCAGFQRSTLPSTSLAGSGPLVKARRVFGGEVQSEGGTPLWMLDLEAKK